MNLANWTLSITSTGQYSGCLFISNAPAITSNPPNRNICSGGNTTFPITATGATSYQWYQNTGSGFVALTNTSPFSGVTTSTLTITGATAAINGALYQCVATNTSGSATSTNATLTVASISANGIKTDVSCNGGSNGAINLTPAGGTSPYTFNWGGGITTEDRMGLSPGTYTVTVTDNIGCFATTSFVINQPATVVSGTTVITNILCNGGSNGAINLTPAGGTSPYTFNWGAGITTEDRTGLAAGTYTVVITDANGCTATVNATVTQPATAVSGTTVITNISCNGGSNGAINLTPAGGTSPYTFNWGGGITTEDRTGLAAGTYTVVITDANGCTATVNATVTQPIALSATISQTNVSCNGGSNGTATITVSGGATPYTYSWSPSGGTAAIATGLIAGTYTVTVTDANLCTITRTVTITQSGVVGAPTGAAVQSFNAGNNLSTLVANGQNIKWYASAGNASSHTGSLAMTTLIVNNTTYYATQTSGGCESTASLAVLAFNLSLGVGNVTKEKSEMQIYPNPVREILNITGQEKIIKVVITSPDGKKVSEKILNNNERSIDVHTLVQGMYIIQIYTQKNIQTFKFIKK
jgi:hypothetical protein